MLKLWPLHKRPSNRLWLYDWMGPPTSLTQELLPSWPSLCSEACSQALLHCLHPRQLPYRSKPCPSSIATVTVLMPVLLSLAPSWLHKHLELTSVTSASAGVTLLGHNCHYPLDPKVTVSPHKPMVHVSFPWPPHRQHSFTNTTANNKAHNPRGIISATSPDGKRDQEEFSNLNHQSPLTTPTASADTHCISHWKSLQHAPILTSSDLTSQRPHYTGAQNAMTHLTVLLVLPSLTLVGEGLFIPEAAHEVLKKWLLQ
jgi:hypothetical protein